MQTASELKHGPAETEQELRRRFENMHMESRSGVAPSADIRIDRLERLRKMLIDNEDAIVEAISSDFGNRSVHETKLIDILMTLNSIRNAKENLREWMKPSIRDVAPAFQPAQDVVRYEPIGVIGIMSPWNYPLFLCLGPLVDALAAGNRAMIKPSGQVPNTSDLLGKMIAETFDEREVTVVVGDHALSDVFSSLPFDHIVFTGSTRIGERIMQTAARNLTPVTLELGGKSPVVVCDDYSIDAAAKSVSFGKFLNAGQTCIAPDYALVPKDKVETFAEAMLAHARAKYPTIAKNNDFTSIISEKAYDRLTGWLEEAREAGARVMSVEDDGAAEFRKIPPTVVLDAPGNSELLTHEIFGPILPIVGYESLEMVAEYINARPRPLALYAFSNDSSQLDGILDRSISGGVTLKGTMLHAVQEGMAFGGIGSSGMGGYHGHDGFLRFSHARSVHEVGATNNFESMGPPWDHLGNISVAVLEEQATANH